MDELTRLTIRVIALEAAIEELNKDKERNDNVYLVQGELEIMFLALQDRVKILEEARLRQISFNQTVQIKTVPVKVPDKKTFWPWK